MINTLFLGVSLTRSGAYSRVLHTVLWIYSTSSGHPTVVVPHHFQYGQLPPSPKSTLCALPQTYPPQPPLREGTAALFHTTGLFTASVTLATPVRAAIGQFNTSRRPMGAAPEPASSNGGEAQGRAPC